MKKVLFTLVIFLFFMETQAAPPFNGTIFIEPNIITPEDPSSFSELKSLGTNKRKMFDRRVNAWITSIARIFLAKFDDGAEIEVQVNSEFDSEEAFKIAQTYLSTIGQLPSVLRKDIQTVWIHKGNENFGGGNNNLLIHTDKGAEYISKGILAETFIHEATHTSLDAYHSSNKQWLNAQKRDEQFISKYAKNNPEREDLAESFLLYLAVRYKPNRIGDEVTAIIKNTIPNRIAYFDALKLEMHPIKNMKVR